MPTYKEMVAFKIGARARKFALEGCPMEGYDLLYAYLENARTSDPALHELLQKELEKYEARLAAMDEDEN